MIRWTCPACGPKTLAACGGLSFHRSQPVTLLNPFNGARKTLRRAPPIPPTNERGLLHRWHDRDDPSLWDAESVFLDGPDHAFLRAITFQLRTPAVHRRTTKRRCLTTVNRMVAGSNPARGASKIKYLLDFYGRPCGTFLSGPRRGPLQKINVVISSPARRRCRDRERRETALRGSGPHAKL